MVIFILLLAIAEIFLAFMLGRFQMQKFGVELVTLISVLGGFVYGAIVGLVLGIVFSILHYLLSQSFGQYLFYSIPMFGLIGFIAGLLPYSNIIFLGIVLSLVYNIITALIGGFASGDFGGELVWSGTDFIMNFILFFLFVPIVENYRII